MRCGVVERAGLTELMGRGQRVAELMGGWLIALDCQCGAQYPTPAPTYHVN